MSSFLHMSLPHLVLNLFAFLYLGFDLESYLGTKKIISIFLLSSLMGNMWTLVNHPNALACGLSCALMGYMGCLLCVYIVRMDAENYMNILCKGNFIVLCSVIALNIFLSLQSSMNLAGHLGGLT